MITHIDIAIMYVADQQRTIDFYAGKLGFTVTTDQEMWPGARWVELTPPGGQTRITVHDAARFDRRPGEGAFLIFACDDVEETARQLRAADATVTDPVRESWGSYVNVTDPDGHQMMVVQK